MTNVAIVVSCTTPAFNVLMGDGMTVLGPLELQDFRQTRYKRPLANSADTPSFG
jgi:hypothetical protein